MINIDDEDLDEETLEDKVFEKADYIGEVITGERKIKFALPKRDIKIKIVKPKKPSIFKTTISNFKKSFNKYKNMPLHRLIGLSIILILAITCVAIVGYLVMGLMVNLLKYGVIGFAIFSVFICALSACGILLLASRYTRK
jgi:hypothetical protein